MAADTPGDAPLVLTVDAAPWRGITGLAGTHGGAPAVRLCSLAHLRVEHTYTQLTAGFVILDETLLWASPALPGAVHDILAARQHGIVDALAAVGVNCWADKANRGALGAIRTPCWGRWEALWPARSLTRVLPTPTRRSAPVAATTFAART